jgi:hypothetical protein
MSSGTICQRTFCSGPICPWDPLSGDELSCYVYREILRDTVSLANSLFFCNVARDRFPARRLWDHPPFWADLTAALFYTHPPTWSVTDLMTAALMRSPTILGGSGCSPILHASTNLVCTDLMTAALMRSPTILGGSGCSPILRASTNLVCNRPLDSGAYEITHHLGRIWLQPYSTRIHQPGL